MQRQALRIWLRCPGPLPAAICAAISPFARQLIAVLQSAEHMFDEFPNAGKPIKTENVRVIHFWYTPRALRWRAKLDFVRLGREAQCLRHTYDAVFRNILRFAVRRGALINVSNPKLEPDGSDGVTECQTGFSIPRGGVRDAAGGEQIAGP